MTPWGSHFFPSRDKFELAHVVQHSSRLSRKGYERRSPRAPSPPDVYVLLFYTRECWKKRFFVCFVHVRQHLSGRLRRDWCLKVEDSTGITEVYCSSTIAVAGSFLVLELHFRLSGMTRSGIAVQEGLLLFFFRYS